jgi:hypothetical protein
MMVNARMKDGRVVTVDVAARDIVGRTPAYTLKAVSKVTKLHFGQATISFEVAQ